MQQRRRKPLANLIDFAAAVKRREESYAAALTRKDIEFLPFSFSKVTVRDRRIELVIDAIEGVGISMKLKDARLLAKALRGAIRSAKKDQAG